MQDKVVMQCVEVIRKNPWVKLFHFKVLGDVDLETWSPGRHVNLYYPCAAARVRRRSYSLTARYDTEIVEILVQKGHENGVSSFLHSNLRKGDILFADGVAGDITVESVLGRQKVLMLASGIGITLPLALLRELKELHDNQVVIPKVKLLLSVAYLEELPVLDELLILMVKYGWFEMSIFITKETLYHDTKSFKAQRISEIDVVSALDGVDVTLLCGGLGFTEQMKGFIATHQPTIEVLEESFYLESVESEVVEREDCSVHVRKDGNVEVIKVCKGDDLLTSLLGNGFQVRHKCRSGIFGQCSVKRLTGAFRHDDALVEPTSIKEGGMLACCSYPVDDVVEVELQ